MLTIGDRPPSFQLQSVVSIEAGKEFAQITDHSHQGKWKLLFAWPMDFTFVYMPPEFLIFGEERMVADLRAAAPAAIVLLHKSTAAYGFPWFGVDYGRQFGAWINESYVKGTLYGDEPLRNGSRGGVRVLWRRDLGAR